MARQALSGFSSKNSSIDQKQTETSLIERFMYPKFGPGQMWEEVARIITSKGGELYINQNVVGCYHNGTSITAIDVIDTTTDTLKRIQGDYFFSTMPIKDLIGSMGSAVPATVVETAQGLQYRDFITVGLLLKKLKIRNTTKEATINDIIPDNWIYVQEIDVKIGRIQVFNNWSPYLVKNPNTVWIGLEYFCTEGDMLWEKSDSDFCSFACDELEKIGIIDRQDILDSVVIKIKKAYPAYFGTYDSFSTIREYIDRFTNLYLIGRNGMHRYNNQDHSMLTAMVAVNNIINGVSSKENIWEINTEDDYHESV